jgi:hypothetical protein
MRLLLLLIGLVTTWTSPLSDAEPVTLVIPHQYQGKTLWELGFVTALEVSKGDKPELNKANGHLNSEGLRKILFDHRIAEYGSAGMLMGLQPTLKITYDNGITVYAEPYAATISVPGQKPFRCLLLHREQYDQRHPQPDQRGPAPKTTKPVEQVEDTDAE